MAGWPKRQQVKTPMTNPTCERTEAPETLLTAKIVTIVSLLRLKQESKAAATIDRCPYRLSWDPPTRFCRHPIFVTYCVGRHSLTNHFFVSAITARKSQAAYE
jgi:hypothetical protein